MAAEQPKALYGTLQSPYTVIVQSLVNNWTTITYFELEYAQ